AQGEERASKKWIPDECWIPRYFPKNEECVLRATPPENSGEEWKDWGVDPVHTSDDKDVRLEGHLGAGVGVKERRLVVQPSIKLPLSVSSERLPFAGYNDPRRLLMAAKAQCQAVPLVGGKKLLIHNEPLA